MNAFTDDDLKLLKEKFSGFYWKCLGTKGPGSDYFIDLGALLARLEAAEAKAIHGDCTCIDLKSVLECPWDMAWREAAGK